MNVHRFLILLGVSSAALAACSLWRDREEVDCLIEENAGMFWNTSGCLKAAKEYCTMNADGGPDAEQPDADACRQAGFPLKGLRMGRCGPAAPEGFATPSAVWFGLVKDLPDGCNVNLGSWGGRYYRGLKAASADDCPACACGGPKGTCELTVDHLTFRNASCDETASVTTDATPNANWTGSCTAEGAIPKGAECPPGSGIPCAKSLELSALPKPTEGCQPTVTPVPIPLLGEAQWEEAVLSCRITPFEPSPELLHSLQEKDKTPQDHSTCIGIEDGWRTCVYAETPGIVPCNLDSPYTQQMVVYKEDAIEDTRSCSPCACTPMGGSCQAAMNLYEDTACQQVLAVTTLDSNNTYCENMPAVTSAVGSKEIAYLEYVPGTCQAAGGELSGGLKLDQTRARTFCCLEQEPEDIYDVYQ